MKNHVTDLLLHEVPPMTEFEYRKKKYRTITWPKSTVFNKGCGQFMQVIDLATNKTARIGYFTKVSIVSEKIENSKF